MTHEPDQHEIPLELLLLDAAAALELVQLHGLSRACSIANAILSGEPVLGESFVGDVVECIEAAKVHAHHDTEDTRVALITAIDTVETWGLEPERRVRNAVRELVASMESIRQVSHETDERDREPFMQLAATLTTKMRTINAITQRSLGVLGFDPYKPDAFADVEPCENHMAMVDRDANCVACGEPARHTPECVEGKCAVACEYYEEGGDDDAT